MMRPILAQAVHYRITGIFYSLLIITVALCISRPSAADDIITASKQKPKIDISGFWQLDEVLSDDPKPALKDIGKIRKKKKNKPQSASSGNRKPVGSDTYRRYWEHVSNSKEWRTTADAAHGGSVKSLLFNQRLAIAATEHGFKVWYEDGFVRDINPNPYGRVFSANGDELVANDLGRTLSYVKKKRIVSETRTKPRGEILETFEPSAAGEMLTVVVTIDRPDWDKIVKLKQVYRRLARTEQKNAVDGSSLQSSNETSARGAPELLPN